MRKNQDNYINITRRNIPSGMSRRSFLKRFGGGVVIAVALADFAMIEDAMAQQYPEDFNAYLLVGTDGRVTCYTGKIEMGQGIITSLAQMMAEELDLSPYRVDMVMGDTDLCPYDRGTWGSQSTRIFGPALRSAAAGARAVLLAMASEKLGVSEDNLTVNDGVIQVNGKQESVTYADLTKGARIIKSLDEKPKLKDPKDFKVIGKPMKRTDSVLKVTGKAIYSGDIKLPGMVYAKILRPPSHAAKLTKLDVSAVENDKEITLIRDGDLVAVLHKDPEVAEKYLAKIKAEYDVPPTQLNENTIFDHLIRSAPEGTLVNQQGDVKASVEPGQIEVASSYLDGYVAHAPMEPHTAVAVVENGRMKVWASTQNPFGLKDSIAQTLGMQPDNVQVLQVFTGGGFGGKSSNGQAIEAARLAKMSGKPVMVAWTRREEFFYDTFRPAAVVKVNSATRQDGKITHWDYGVYFAGQRGAQHFYDIPNSKTIAFNAGWQAPGVHPFGTGAWRAPSNNTNTFARESQINIMAAKIGMDPVDFRFKNLKDERMIRTLKAAADRFGWTPIKSPSAKGWGVACGVDAGSYVALMAEAIVDKETGKVQVERVVVAQDMGLVINPQGATTQAEGCVIMGLGYALTEDVLFTGGEVRNRNFDSYEIPKFSWTPKIETVLLDLPYEPPQGGGEPAIIVMGALLANAIYDAAGIRLYQMPMNPDRVLAALRS